MTPIGVSENERVNYTGKEVTRLYSCFSSTTTSETVGVTHECDGQTERRTDK